MPKRKPKKKRPEPPPAPKTWAPAVAFLALLAFAVRAFASFTGNGGTDGGGAPGD